MSIKYEDYLRTLPQETQREIAAGTAELAREDLRRVGSTPPAGAVHRRRAGFSASGHTMSRTHKQGHASLPHS